MVGELMMLPLRFGVRVTRLWLRATEETVAIAANVTIRVVGVVRPRDENGSLPGAAHDGGRDGFASEQSPARPSTVRTSPLPDVEAAPSLPSPEPLRAQPEHVSEEATLVEEFAEPGAEDGAGAEVHVDPPWDGYDELNAKQVVSRLGAASSAELAAVQLYESGKRRRQTILNAVQRELRARNGRGSPSQ